MTVRAQTTAAGKHALLQHRVRVSVSVFKCLCLCVCVFTSTFAVKKGQPHDNCGELSNDGLLDGPHCKS